MRLIVAITGASGVAYGKRLLEVLHKKKIETHLIISKAAEKILNMNWKPQKKRLRNSPVMFTQ